MSSERIEPPFDSPEPIARGDLRSCDTEGCGEPMQFRVYAAYNADHGENVHPLHARYPSPMYRSCPAHVGVLALRDAGTRGATRQYLIVVIGD